MAGLSIQRTNEINSLSAELLADKGIIKSERGPNNARVVDQQQVLAEMEKRADQIAASSGGKVTAQEVKDAAKNIRDAAQQAGSDVNNATAFLRLLQGNTLLANRSLSEMNQSGEIKTLAQQQRHNPVEFRNALGAQYPDIASLQTAMGKVSAGLPDMTSAAGSRLPNSSHAPGTWGNFGDRVSGAVGGREGLMTGVKNVGIDALFGLGGGWAIKELGGNKDFQLGGGAILAAIGRPLMNGTLAETDMSRTIMQAVGGYALGKVTSRGDNNLDIKDLGAVILGNRGGGGLDTVISNRGGIGGILGGIFGGGRNNEILIPPGTQHGYPGRGNFNTCSGFCTSGSMDPNVAGVMAMHALRDSGYGFTGNQIGSGGAGVAMATMQENPVYRALYGMQ